MIGTTSFVASYRFDYCPGFGSYRQFVLKPGEGFALAGSNSKVSYLGYVEWEETLL